MGPSPSSGSTSSGLSDALHEAFLRELKLAAAKRSASDGFGIRFEPDPFHFNQGRWFAGDSPPPGAPEVVFDEDNITVFFGESGYHQQFFADGDDPRSIRAAARHAVRFLYSDYGRSLAMPPRSPRRRRAVGALWGALVGLVCWLYMVFSPPAFEGSTYAFGLIFMVTTGALIGALALAPSR